MDNYKKFGVVAGQIFMGLGFSLIGGLVGVICYNILAEINGKNLDLPGTIMNMGALTGWCIGLFTGICFDGYNFLKQNGRQNEFLKFLFVSVVGVTVGLFGPSFIFKFSVGLSYVLTISLTVALFLIGILLGSILVLTRDTKQT